MLQMNIHILFRYPDLSGNFLGGKETVSGGQKRHDISTHGVCACFLRSFKFFSGFQEYPDII